jgi:hypothetical protein
MKPKTHQHPHPQLQTLFDPLCTLALLPTLSSIVWSTQPGSSYGFSLSSFKSIIDPHRVTAPHALPVHFPSLEPIDELKHLSLLTTLRLEGEDRPDGGRPLTVLVNRDADDGGRVEEEGECGSDEAGAGELGRGRYGMKEYRISFAHLSSRRHASKRGSEAAELTLIALDLTTPNLASIPPPSSITHRSSLTPANPSSPIDAQIPPATACHIPSSTPLIPPPSPSLPSSSLEIGLLPVTGSMRGEEREDSREEEAARSSDSARPRAR